MKLAYCNSSSYSFFSYSRSIQFERFNGSDCRFLTFSKQIKNEEAERERENGWSEESTAGQTYNKVEKRLIIP